jgi:nicotinate-nucleotide adenylyltransferase
MEILTKKVGIIGGTFDPPHIGHLIIADQILHRYQLQEIWFMPNYLPPHKEKTSNTSACDRLKMLELAIEDHPSFKIETIELERNGKSYTYDTMRLLRKREPNTEFFFIIGADMVEFLPNWYKIEELIKLVRFIGVNRPEYQTKTAYPIDIVTIPDVYISSSMIREKIAKGESVKYLVPNSVLQYIKEKGLYGSK